MRKISTVFTLICLFLTASVAFADGTIKGTVKIAPALKGHIGAEAALYIIARMDGAAGGPPTAVKRFAAPLKFPLSFEISSNDAMMPGATLDGKFTLTARVSQNGAAFPPNAGDIQTSAPMTGVQPGGKPVVLSLSEVKK